MSDEEDFRKAAEESDYIVTARDAIRKGLCGRSQKVWAEEHDLDFRDFLKNGASARFLLSFNDAMLDIAVKSAWERMHGR